MLSIATMTSELNASGPIAWSPDGSQIAFDDEVLRVVPSTGGSVRDYGVGADSVAWSPDGTQIAMHGGGIILVDAASGEPTRLTSDMGGAVEYPPVWSPDGRWLAYVGSDGTLRVMDVATRGVVRLGIEGDQVRWAQP